MQESEIAKLEAARQDQRLNATVYKEADAVAYTKRGAVQVEARASATRTTGEAEAAVTTAAERRRPPPRRQCRRPRPTASRRGPQHHLQRADSEVIGKIGRVTGRIAPGETGETMIAVRGGTSSFHAHPADGVSTHPIGERVLVIDFRSPQTVFVDELPEFVR